MYTRYVLAAAVLLEIGVVAARTRPGPSELLIGELDEPSVVWDGGASTFWVGHGEARVEVIAKELTPRALHRRHGCMVFAEGHYADATHHVFVVTGDAGCAACDKGREDVPEWDADHRRYVPANDHWE